jgi:hypothetical protein
MAVQGATPSNPIGDSGGVDNTAMTGIAKEIKELNLEMARQDLYVKKQTKPAQSAAQAAKQA